MSMEVWVEEQYPVYSWWELVRWNVVEDPGSDCC